MKSMLSVLPFDIAPDSIPLALPLLLAQMEKAKLDVDGIDFNAELYHEFLTEDFIRNSYNLIKQKYENIKENNSDNYNDKHSKKIFETIIKNSNKVESLIKTLPEIKKEFNEKEISLGIRIPHRVMDILKIIFAPYSEFAPWKSFSYIYNYESIKQFAENKDNNIFYNFLLQFGEKYNFPQYDFIGLSLPLENSIYYAFTLGKYIKKVSPKTKVVLGGASVTRLWDDFIKFPDIINTYFDNLLIGDGDNSIIKYSRFISGEVLPEEVPGLVYKDNSGKILFNPPENIDINDIEPPSYSRINMSLYPKNTILNIQFSRGCPWGKCAFCTFSYPYRKKYSILDAQKAVDIIETLVQKYNFHDFYIVDETIPLDFFKKFAKEVIKRRLKIKYDCRLRFENYYTLEIFNLLAKSGLRSIFWGYEAESKRVLEIMNKGSLNADRNTILKMAKQSGILNKLGFIFGFPGETEQEIYQTIDYIVENFQKTFDRFNISIFSLEKNSYVINDPDKYGITNISQKSDFGIGYNFYDKTISRDRIRELINLCMKKIDNKKNLK